MNRYSLTRIIKCLMEGRKGHFTVVCTTRDRRYEFNIFNKVELCIIDLKDDSSSVIMEFKDDCINIPEDEYDIKIIKETIYRNRNQIYTETTYHCLEPIQIYLPVFRVLGEQIVFLLKTGDSIKKMFFVNGRVFYCEEDEESITMQQSDLRKILSYGSEVLFFDRLPKKYSYGSINNLFNNYAIRKNKIFNIVKKGVVVSNS